LLFERFRSLGKLVVMGEIDNAIIGIADRHLNPFLAARPGIGGDVVIAARRV
jgi:hypothetical protein